MKTRILSVALIVCIVLSFAACGGESASAPNEENTETDTVFLTVTDTDTIEPEAISTGELTVEHDEKFGGVFIHITDEDLRALGFEYGDSVDV